jgi:arylsulfatase A-like enzyme
VGALGAALPLTPRIDELASEGVVFETASTTYSSTTAAHLSMLTGRYPIRTGVRGPTRTLPATTALLAEALGAAGWRTAAVTEDAMLAISVGFARGVSHYQENREFEPTAPPVSYKAAHTMGTALRWIEAHRDERFFLFVHTYAVHNPYAPPAEHQFTTWTDGTTERPLSEAPGYVQLARAYAGDVRFADAQVGHLIDTVRRLGLERRTIVVVTSDHGEGFGEREGSWGHATVIHDEIMHVPMILWGPGRIPAGRRIRTPVSLVDLPPTILELAGVPPLANLDGESQAARLDGGADDLERVVFAEGRSLTDRGQRQVAARTATTKWMVTPSKPRSLVAYDLVADPGERRALTDPALLERGRRLIAGYEALATKDATPVRVPVSDDTREQLRALGYLE